MFSKIPLDRSIPKVAEQIEIKEQSLTEEIVDLESTPEIITSINGHAKDTCNSRLAYKLGKELH